MALTIYGLWMGVYSILHFEKNEADLKGLHLPLFWGGNY